MRKLFALTLVALLALGLSFAVVGCGQKTEEEVTTPPPAGETMPPDTSMMMDTTMADTTMSH
jgi:hypothetical protein